MKRKKRIETRVGYVYVMKIHDYCKIGRTVDVRRRVSSINTDSPYKVDKYYSTPLLTDCYVVEEKMHEMLKERHAHGEWFTVAYWYATELLEMISKQYVHHIEKGA